MKARAFIVVSCVIVLFNFSFSASAFYKGASSREQIPPEMLKDLGVDTARDISSMERH